MKTKKTIGLLSFLFLGVTGFAQDFDDRDSDSDGRWDQNEYQESFQDDFEQWDTDADGQVSEEEFNQTTFRNVDENGDSAVDDEEWEYGLTSLYGPYASTEDYQNFDSDDDGNIAEDEWNEGFTNADWYDSYDQDRDGFLTNDELSQGLFSDWDSNGDGVIDEDEYDNGASLFESDY